MSNVQLLDLFTRIFKRTSEISDEVEQLKKDLIEVEKLLKPVQNEFIFLYFIKHFKLKSKNLFQ